MAKQTKNIITRADIEKELRHLNRADLRTTVTFSAIILIICGSICAFVTAIIWHDYNSLNLRLGISISSCLLILSPLILCVLHLFGVQKEKTMLDRGDFYITAAPLAYKSTVTKRRRDYLLFHFVGYPPTSPSRSIPLLTEEGDEFYLVCYHSERPTITLLYPCKMYEYKE